jgi:signal transduction histidine kinase
MRSVNDVTEALQQTHVQLQRQVARLQAELAEANAQLRRSRTLASLGEMAAGIAHEVRNPLASIQLYVQLLQDDLRGQPGHVELCGRINRAVSGVDAIVRDVLMFAREARIHSVDTTASDLLDRALGECEAQLADGHVTVIRDDSGESLRLEADFGLITQALVNVIRNAIQAMVEAESSRRELRLETSRKNRRGPDGCRAPHIVLSVIDSGPGVDPAIVDRMFNPFFTTRRAGTGLGLAIVHRIVDAHGGSVGVCNEPGLGARIDIRLPPSRADRPTSGPTHSCDEFQNSAQNGADHSALIAQHSSLDTQHVFRGAPA